MTREDSIRQIENYPPFNEQEEKDKALILGWIRDNENAFLLIFDYKLKILLEFLQ